MRLDFKLWSGWPYIHLSISPTGWLLEIFYASYLRPPLGGISWWFHVQFRNELHWLTVLAPRSPPTPRTPSPGPTHLLSSSIIILFPSNTFQTNLLGQTPPLLNFNGTHTETQYLGVSSHHLSLPAKAFWPNLGRRLLSGRYKGGVDHFGQERLYGWNASAHRVQKASPTNKTKGFQRCVITFWGHPVTMKWNTGLVLCCLIQSH